MARAKACWLGGHVPIASAFPDEFSAFDEGGSLTATGPLALSLALSVLCSLVGGFVTAKIANRSGAVVVLAVLLLITGIGVQAGAWARMPLWYHIPFLILLLPVTIASGRLAKPTPKEAN